LDVRTRLFGATFVGSVESMTGVAAVTAIIIGALYFGRELFVPIALAILLSFVLAPLVRRCSVGMFHAGCRSSAWSSSHS
jgi:predicted PurR-regulated permease PerM